jgi:hypothetical protein
VDGRKVLSLRFDFVFLHSTFFLKCEYVVGKHFRENLRTYNNVLSFCSLGVQVDESVWGPMGIYTFRIKGTLCHKIGSLLPANGQTPKFAQMYIMDGDFNQQLHHRLQYGHGHIDEGILRDLLSMMHHHNPFIAIFKTAKDRIGQDINLSLNLISFDSTHKDPRRYNLPTASEVGIIINKDTSDVNTARDLIIEYRSGRLQHVSELHAGYLALRFPLLFPYGEKGWHPEIPFSDVVQQSCNDNDNHAEAQEEDHEAEYKSKSTGKNKRQILNVLFLSASFS